MVLVEFAGIASEKNGEFHVSIDWAWSVLC
jgi:hypothetical protein